MFSKHFQSYRKILNEKSSFPTIASNFQFGFTLAEVLITLGIIGVVAAMTLPSLISNLQERILVNQLRVAYNTISQAYSRAIADNSDSEGWDIGRADTAAGSQKLYEIFKPYFIGAEDCGLQKHKCFYDGTYRALFNEKYAWQPSTHSSYAKGRLRNGVSVLFWSNGTGCPNNTCGAITVDINGETAPNQAGVDYFTFIITPQTVIPADGILKSSKYGSVCKYKSSSSKNGAYCTAWVINKGNMDYRRRDIQADWRGNN